MEYAIWGAGRIGEAAYIYFKKFVNIVFYVDGNEKKWGNTLNGLQIYSPDILQSERVKVIIAMKNGQDHVRERLENEYNITDYTIFSFFQKNYTKCICNKNEKKLEKNSVVICCSDGLGNQMFQYALYRNLQCRGRNVYMDISSYDAPGPNMFLLSKVFPDIPLRICSNSQMEEYLSSNFIDVFNMRNFQIYVEPSSQEVKVQSKNNNLFQIENGIIRGYHQCYQYAEEIRDNLLKDFSFPDIKEKLLVEIADEIKKTNSVSVHIRRGDYLGRNESIAFGNICTIDYYERSIDYISNKIENPVFYFFSNDILWVRENIKPENAVYIDSSMFTEYADWYDMYLMSICRHNIIANSTFSWWGAWLNRNKNKIVIAPSKWMNICDWIDICPEDWIRLT